MSSLFCLPVVEERPATETEKAAQPPQESKLPPPPTVSAPDRIYFYRSLSGVETEVLRIVANALEVTGPSWLVRFERELQKLGDLPVGWDSYDAPPPGKNSIVGGIRFLERLAELPDIRITPSRIAPLADGGIAVSFLTDTVRSSIEFFDSGEIVATIARLGAESKVWDVESPDEIDVAARRISREISSEHAE